MLHPEVHRPRRYRPPAPSPGWWFFRLVVLIVLGFGTWSMIRCGEHLAALLLDLLFVVAMLVETWEVPPDA